MSTLREYIPSKASPWTLQKAGHLLRRAAFGASWTELQQALKDGPKVTIDKLLKGWAAPGSDQLAVTMEHIASERALPASATGTELAAVWLHRILHTKHALQEKLSIFWHNHFATSLAKVRNARQMYAQYELLHKHALGNFSTLLNEISFDPAMMVWLDTTESKKGKPNENYARELMELFSLGIGNYTETDIREAAKAFTGYEIQGARGTLNEKQHDDSEKTVFKKSGNFKAEDIVKLCLDHTACPKFIVRKLYRYLVSETADIADEHLEELAAGYRKSGFDTGKLVERILRSELFFSETAYRKRIKAPVDFAVGIVRALEGTVGASPLAAAIEPLGQMLFAPPSVKGWDGGRTWLNAQTLLFRQNLALAFTSTSDSRFRKGCDPVRMLEANKVGSTDSEIVDFLLNLFLQGDIPMSAKDKLLGYLADSKKNKYPSYWGEADIRDHRLRTVTHLALTLPEFQLD